MTHTPPGAPRLAGPEPDQLSAEQARVHALIAAGPRGQVVGPLKVWLTSPALAERAQALGQYARYDSVLPPRLSELAILVTARIWSSGFEWAHHAPLALAAGLPAEAVAAIGQGRRPKLADVAARAVLDFSVELHRDRQVSDPVYHAAEAALGPQGLVDLVGICGYYTLISMTINGFAVPHGPGPALLPLDLPPEQMFRA